jgi:hypothetical protein
MIEVTVKTNEVGIREATTYRWAGKSPYIEITWDMIRTLYKPGDDINEIQIGPYKLLFVEDKPQWDSRLYVRKDKLGALRVFFYRSTRWLDLVYRRLIITLAVWGMADYHRSTVPGWRDIKALKRFVK